MTLDKTLIEPVCQASLIRYPIARNGAKSLLLFSNPASKRRDHMTVRLSRDDGKTWPIARLVYNGSAAYSSLVALPDGQFGLLYERDGYRKNTFAIFRLRDLK